MMYGGMAMGHGWLRTFALAGVASLIVVASDGQAQQAQEQAPVAEQCSAIKSETEAGAPALLYVACGDVGVPLGYADDYQLFQLPALRAAAAVTSFEGFERAWLVMREDDGSVVLEEITSTVARLAGRQGQANIDGLAFQLGAGQLTAAIVARGQGPAAAAQPAEIQSEEIQGEIDFARLVARSREVRDRADTKAGGQEEADAR